MIDARELHIGAHVDVRIGDSIKHNKVRICRINDDGKVYCQRTTGKGLLSAYGYHLQPIPITAELLEELGFEHQENGEWYKGLGNGEQVYVTIVKKHNTLYVKIVGHDYWMGNHSTIPPKLHILENLIWIMLNKKLI